MSQTIYNIGVHLMGRSSALFVQCNEPMRRHLMASLTPESRNHSPLFVKVDDVHGVEHHIRLDQIQAVSSDLIDHQVVHATLMRGVS